MTEPPAFPSDLIAQLRAAGHVAVLTGAGISAESGIPTFRDAMTGLWERYRPEELATPQAFAGNPRLVWDWYTWRRSLVAAAEPNPGHHAVRRLEDLVDRVTVVTQNVDGLHERAGSSNVVELHGNLMRTRCSKEGTVVDTWEESEEGPPPCPRCGALLRPDVVWFGEMLPPGALDAAHDVVTRCDVLFSVGTSNIVEPAASLPWIAASAGTPVAVINPDMGGQRSGPGIHHLVGLAGTVLPALVAEVWEAGQAL